MLHRVLGFSVDPLSAGDHDHSTRFTHAVTHMLELRASRLENRIRVVTCGSSAPASALGQQAVAIRKLNPPSLGVAGAGFWSGSESGRFGPQDEHGGLASAEYGRDGGQRGYRG
jgi:hypothetical protein